MGDTLGLALRLALGDARLARLGQRYLRGEPLLHGRIVDFRLGAEFFEHGPLGGVGGAQSVGKALLFENAHGPLGE